MALSVNVRFISSGLIKNGHIKSDNGKRNQPVVTPFIFMELRICSINRSALQANFSDSCKNGNLYLLPLFIELLQTLFRVNPGNDQFYPQSRSLWSVILNSEPLVTSAVIQKMFFIPFTKSIHQASITL